MRTQAQQVGRPTTAAQPSSIEQSCCIRCCKRKKSGHLLSTRTRTHTHTHTHTHNVWGGVARISQYSCRCVLGLTTRLGCPGHASSWGPPLCISVSMLLHHMQHHCPHLMSKVAGFVTVDKGTTRNQMLAQARDLYHKTQSSSLPRRHHDYES